MADYWHARDWGSSHGPYKLTNPPPPAHALQQGDEPRLVPPHPPPTPLITTPPHTEFVLIATHVSNQGAGVLMEAEGREGESEGFRSEGQSL